eukprot:Colp12_sorted_trinity150504_noHs@36132
MAKKTEKNFVTQNAVDAIQSVARKPHDDRVDYRHKRDYGKVPNYLTKRREDLNNSYDDGYDYDSMSSHIKIISEEEKNEILNGLRANWQKVHHDYQTLSLAIDSAPKKARKLRCEAQMKQFEKDIEMLEKHKVVVVNYAA